MLLDSNFNAIKTPSPLCVSLKNSTEFRPPSWVKKSLQTSTMIHWHKNDYILGVVVHRKMRLNKPPNITNSQLHHQVSHSATVPKFQDFLWSRTYFFRIFSWCRNLIFRVNSSLNNPKAQKTTVNANECACSKLVRKYCTYTEYIWQIIQ